MRCTSFTHWHCRELLDDDVVRNTLVTMKKTRTFPTSDFSEERSLPITDKGFREIVEVRSQLPSVPSARVREGGREKADEEGEKCIELTDIDFKCAAPCYSG